MQINIIIFALTAFVSAFLVNGHDKLVSESRDIGLTVCQNIYGLLAYPRFVQNITVIGSSPLRIRAHLLAQGPSKAIPFSVEGMVCDAGFNQNSANAACRSQNAPKAIFATGIEWQESTQANPQRCIMDTGDYKSTIPCEHILHSLVCPPSATGLHQCQFPHIFSSTPLCNRYTHVGLICI